MISNSESNVQFTDEQSKQLEAWSGRLAVLQDEIRKAEGQSGVLSTEIQTLEKHRDYLTNEITPLEKSIKKLQQQKLGLEDEIQTSVNLLEEHVKETSKRSAAVHEKETGHREREQSLNKSYDELQEMIEEHRNDVQELSERQLLVEKAEKAFLKAVETIAWK